MAVLTACSGPTFVILGADAGEVDATRRSDATGSSDAARADGRGQPADGARDSAHADTANADVSRRPRCTVTGTPYAIATNQGGPTDIALDPSYLYWTNVTGAMGASCRSGHDCGSIARGARSAGAPVTTMASGIPSLAALVSDGSSLFWSQNDSTGGWAYIATVPTTPGETPTNVAAYGNGCCFESLVVDGTNVYWTAQVAVTGVAVGAVDTAAKTATDDMMPTELAAAKNSSPTVLAADTGALYFGDALGESVDEVSKSGGEVVTLATNQGTVTAIAADSKNVYWATNSGAVMALAKPTTAPAGTPITLATNQASPSSLAFDACSVYWTNAGSTGNGDGSVVGVPIAGGKMVTLATGLDSPSGIAVDDTGVYWAETGSGRVRGISR